MPNLFIFSLISSNFRANVVCSGKHKPFSYELCHCARHFSLEKFRLVENRLYQYRWPVQLANTVNTVKSQICGLGFYRVVSISCGLIFWVATIYTVGPMFGETFGLTGGICMPKNSAFGIQSKRIVTMHKASQRKKNKYRSFTCSVVVISVKSCLKIRCFTLNPNYTGAYVRKSLDTEF